MPLFLAARRQASGLRQTEQALPEGDRQGEDQSQGCDRDEQRTAGR